MNRFIRSSILFISCISLVIIFIHVNIFMFKNDINISSCFPSFSVSAEGTYYLSVNGEVDLNTYFLLNNGKWEDENGFSGKYAISQGEITLYANDMVLVSGTIGDGKMELKISQYTTKTYIRQ